ncbi:hypothetical protein J6497_06815 [Bradyrhizobium sp. CNPSo 4026]|nr:hypothetical protein [Bradyrhizobium cenepequi]
MDGLLKDATRPSRVKPLPSEKIKQVVHMTLHEKPPNATDWSVRSMAKAAGISYSSAQRIWHAHGLKPHLVNTFKVSRDKNFAAKVEDVIELEDLKFRLYGAIGLNTTHRYLLLKNNAALLAALP